MRVQAGLRADDWTHRGQRTTFKSKAQEQGASARRKRNVAELLRKSLRPRQAGGSGRFLRPRS
jgi:hypothetical protein